MPSIDADTFAIVNSNIDITNRENRELLKELYQLKNNDSGAAGELKQKNFIYNQLYVQNIVLLVMILGLSGLYVYKRKA